MNQNSDYYNKNADLFFNSTYQVEMESLYAPFLRYLPEHAVFSTWAVAQVEIR